MTIRTVICTFNKYKKGLMCSCQGKRPPLTRNRVRMLVTLLGQLTRAVMNGCLMSNDHQHRDKQSKREIGQLRQLQTPFFYETVTRRLANREVNYQFSTVVWQFLSLSHQKRGRKNDVCFESLITTALSPSLADKSLSINCAAFFSPCLVACMHHRMHASKSEKKLISLQHF